MALAFEDRIAEFSTTTGLGPFTVTGAINSTHKPFSSKLSIGATFDGGIVGVDPVTGAETGQWQTGVFTYTAANTIDATTVYASSKSDSTKVSFNAGTKRIFMGLTAFRIATLSGISVPIPGGGTPPPPAPGPIANSPTGITSNQTVTLTSGTTYVGNINISGLSGVTINTTGAAKARVTNGQSVSGWSLHTGNIWKAALTFQPTNVSIDRAPCNLAHFPSRTTRMNTSTGGTANTLTYGWPNTDLVGCLIMIRPHNSRIDDYNINSMSGNTATFSPNIIETADANGKQFWVEGHKLHLMTELNSWCYISGTLYVWAPDGLDPSSHEVWASTNVDGVNANNSSNCAINNVEVMNGNRGVSADSAQSLDILNCLIENSRDVGIYGGSSANGLIVDNCDVINSFHTGIDCYFGSNTNTIRNSRINNCGLVGNPRWGRGLFIGVGSTGNVIDNNTITNTTYTGIDVNRNYNTNITRNTVDNACAVLDDGGGIYTQSIGNATTLNMLIDGNTVQNCAQPQAHGIYLDDDASGVTVTNNKCNNNKGSNLFMHNAKNNTVRGNTFVANSSFTVVQIAFQSDGVGRVSGNVIDANTFTTKGTIKGVYNEEATSDLGSYGTFTGNIYNHQVAAQFARTWPGTGPGVDRDFASWKTVVSDNGTYVQI